MSFESHRHGRYVIRSGPLRGAWAANAFRHDTRVAAASGASREEAVANVVSELDRLDGEARAGRDADGAPPAAVYAEAFARLLPDMPASYYAMLRAHLAAPELLISATRLAAAAGYTGYSGANLHYGLLGQRVADEIGFDPPRRDDGTEVWTCAIARDPGAGHETGHAPDPALRSDVDSGHFEWQLRPQVAEALRSLGW